VKAIALAIALAAGLYCAAASAQRGFDAPPPLPAATPAPATQTPPAIPNPGRRTVARLPEAERAKQDAPAPVPAPTGELADDELLPLARQVAPETRIEQKRQTLDVHVSDQLPNVLGDELRLKQILINLLSNASKFTGEGGRLCVAAQMDEPGIITVAVADTGCGMTPDEIERALEPFAQIRSTYSRNEEGTGLGLTIAKALVLQHGGKLNIRSQPKVGTTVTFTLPAATEESRKSGGVAARSRP